MTDFTLLPDINWRSALELGQSFRAMKGMETNHGYVGAGDSARRLSLETYQNFRPSLGVLSENCTSAGERRQEVVTKTHLRSRNSKAVAN